MGACELQIQSKPLSQNQNLLAYLCREGVTAHKSKSTSKGTERKQSSLGRILLCGKGLWKSLAGSKALIPPSFSAAGEGPSPLEGVERDGVEEGTAW